jgi:hypothetical protein
MEKNINLTLQNQCSSVYSFDQIDEEYVKIQLKKRLNMGWQYAHHDHPILSSMQEIKEQIENKGLHEFLNHSETPIDTFKNMFEKLTEHKTYKEDLAFLKNSTENSHKNLKKFSADEIGTFCGLGYFFKANTTAKRGFELNSLHGEPVKTSNVRKSFYDSTFFLGCEYIHEKSGITYPTIFSVNQTKKKPELIAQEFLAANMVVDKEKTYPFVLAALLWDAYINQLLRKILPQ